MSQEQKITFPLDISTRQLTIILNKAYPVGCYFETTDISFNPNDSFVGQWILEEEGKVHIGAGASYQLGTTGGSKDAIVPYHKHLVSSTSTDEMDANVTHSHTYEYKGDSASALSGSNPPGFGNVVRRKEPTSNTGHTTAETNIDHKHTVPSHSTNYVGEVGNIIDANMPPYIVVNRWHRIG